jgi:S-formylglutathione hydrolase
MHSPWSASTWRQWDACELLREAGEKLPLLVDQGSDDEFLEGQLRPQLLQAAADAAGHPLTLRMQPGYDHSYYFIASFIGEHVAHHAAALQGCAGGQCGTDAAGGCCGGH